MKIRFYFGKGLLIAFLMFIGFQNLQATHIIGGEMSYTCLGNNVYQITILMYRDCQSNGAAFDSAPGAFTTGTVSVFRRSLMGEFRNIELDPPVITELDVETDNPCLIAPPNICVQQAVYTFPIALPLSSEEYTITYQRCCRNPTITNITNPSSIGSTFSVEINPFAQDECNNSPSFNELPPALVCANTPLAFDHSASDIDGDSLVYSFCAPSNGASQNNPAPDPDLPPPYIPINFGPGYSATEPMRGSPVVSIDPITGLITGTPTVQGQFVVGVCVQEFRQGMLISEIQRDFQFNVVECVSLLDAFIESSATVGETALVYSCNELDVFVENESFPATNIDAVNWIVQIDEDSTYTSSAVDLDITLPAVGTYNGVMVLNPGTSCTDSVVFAIEVAPELVATTDISVDSCSLTPIQFESTNPLPNVTAEWSFGDGNTAIGQTVEYSYDDPGEYLVELIITDEIGCVDTIETAVPWYPLSQNLNIDLLNVEGCAPLEVTYTANVVLTDDYRVLWDYGDGSTGQDLDGSHIYRDLGSFSLSLLVESPLGCQVERLFEDDVQLRFGLYIPNAFSPNQDGINEDFCIYSPCVLDEYELSIFDTWGTLLFDSTNQDDCWNGKLKGQRVVPGVYTWLLQYTDHLDNRQVQYGDITVIR